MKTLAVALLIAPAFSVNTLIKQDTVETKHTHIEKLGQYIKEGMKELLPIGPCRSNGKGIGRGPKKCFNDGYGDYAYTEPTGEEYEEAPQGEDYVEAPEGEDYVEAPTEDYVEAPTEDVYIEAPAEEYDAPMEGSYLAQQTKHTHIDRLGQLIKEGMRDLLPIGPCRSNGKGIGSGPKKCFNAGYGEVAYEEPELEAEVYEEAPAAEEYEEAPAAEEYEEAPAAEEYEEAPATEEYGAPAAEEYEAPAAEEYEAPAAEEYEAPAAEEYEAPAAEEYEAPAAEEYEAPAAEEYEAPADTSYLVQQEEGETKHKHIDQLGQYIRQGMRELLPIGPCRSNGKGIGSGPKKCFANGEEVYEVEDEPYVEVDEPEAPTYDDEYEEPSEVNAYEEEAPAEEGDAYDEAPTDEGDAYDEAPMDEGDDYADEAPMEEGDVADAPEETIEEPEEVSEPDFIPEDPVESPEEPLITPSEPEDGGDAAEEEPADEGSDDGSFLGGIGIMD